MRLKSLIIENYKAIKRLHLADLPDTIVIAGPNGCGKSCVFDAVRMIKSAYGGYRPNEFSSWLGEFHLDEKGLNKLLQDPTKAARIEMELVLSESELKFLKDKAGDVVQSRALDDTAISPNPLVGPRVISLAAQQRTTLAKAKLVSAKLAPEYLNELERGVLRGTFRGQLMIRPDGAWSVHPSLVLESVFGMYEPQSIGILDYHGPTRHYGRERMNAINLRIESTEQKIRNHALYDSQSKYSNLKGQMAAAYVREMLIRKAVGDPGVEEGDLLETLRELFRIFLPSKTFGGPVPTSDGGLSFPVTTAVGATHDIDELSSGEKEVLYGYLQLRNAAPHNSVLMIDEPELHLNPRLVSGLVDFYRRHLGKLLNSQLWLVSHSDTIIREAVADREVVVFHMQSAEQVGAGNQVSRVSAKEDIDRVIVDLVGDLAVYRPSAKIVVFEGGGDTEFDVRMTTELFPKFANAVNAISGGDKRRVSDLHEMLEHAREKASLPGRFYSVTDGDGENRATEVPRQHKWNVYHIENYLLVPKFIREVLADQAQLPADLASDEAVEKALQKVAAETIPSLVAHELKQFVYNHVHECIDLHFDPKRPDVAVAISEAIARSHVRMNGAVGVELSQAELGKRAQDWEASARVKLSDGRWRVDFRGRDVLRRFVGAHTKDINYEVFRNMILARMRDAKFEPPGMKSVTDLILADPWPPVKAVGPATKSAGK